MTKVQNIKKKTEPGVELGDLLHPNRILRSSSGLGICFSLRLRIHD
jgi:hypothetical protein